MPIFQLNNRVEERLVFIRGRLQGPGVQVATLVYASRFVDWQAPVEDPPVEDVEEDPIEAILALLREP